jgi:hypothetical protein
MPGSVLVGNEIFAIAESFDSETSRYKGLVLPEDGNAEIQPLDSLLIVRPEKADAQRLKDLETDSKPEDADEESTVVTPPSDPATEPPGTVTVTNNQKTRFFGSVTIDPQLYGRDFTNLSREVLDRLADGDVELEITVEIQAKKRTGFDESVRRTVTENAKALKFDQTSFEAD